MAVSGALQKLENRQIARRTRLTAKQNNHMLWFRPQFSVGNPGLKKRRAMYKMLARLFRRIMLLARSHDRFA
jgi:hypothetical protein